VEFLISIILLENYLGTYIVDYTLYYCRAHDGCLLCCFFSPPCRRRNKVRAQFLFGPEGAERVGLSPGDRFRPVRAGQAGGVTPVSVGG